MSNTTLAPREATVRDPGPAIERPAPTPAKPNEGEPSKKDRDPMLDLLDKFERVSAAVGVRDPGMAAGLTQLVEQSAEPGRTGQPLFRTQVAYMLQDVEKLAGTTAVSVPAELRAELTRLAATSPGLENRQMQALVKSTPEIGDRGVIRDIRRAAASIAAMGEGQNSPQAAETVEVLENRMRLAARFSPNEASASPAVRVSSAVAADLLDRTEISEEKLTSAEVRNGTISNGANASERIRTAASPGDNASEDAPPKLERRSSPNSPSDPATGPLPVAGKPKGLLSSIMDGVRPPSGGPRPWEPPPAAMKMRVQSFEDALAKGRTDQHIRAAEKSGERFMQSMETFMTGPGAGVLGKIEAAASTEPGGMRAVMSEMQPGGRYASLRSEFDGALQQDRAFAASFNAVEKAAGQYGQDRLTLAADFQARKMDASQLDARFQQADAAIGEAAEKIPGRGAGQTIMAEMAEKVSEMLSKAAQRVRQLFGKEAEAGPRPASPSPAP